MYYNRSSIAEVFMTFHTSLRSVLPCRHLGIFRIRICIKATYLPFQRLPFMCIKRYNNKIENKHNAPQLQIVAPVTYHCKQPQASHMPAQ